MPLLTRSHCCVRSDIGSLTSSYTRYVELTFKLIETSRRNVGEVEEESDWPPCGYCMDLTAKCIIDQVNMRQLIKHVSKSLSTNHSHYNYISVRPFFLVNNITVMCAVETWCHKSFMSSSEIEHMPSTQRGNRTDSNSESYLCPSHTRHW